MTTGRPGNQRRGSNSLVVGLAFTAIGLVLGATAATAAPGAQAAPSIDPSPVATAATPFSLSNGTCDGTGGAGWRVQTFIVDGNVDVSTLTFESGVASDQVGTDRDASDGSIRSPLFKGGAPGTGFFPAASPAGLINPADLAGFTFGDAGWTLVDGVYQIGYGCLDEQSVLRQWWSLAVTIDADASPGAFLTVGGAAATTTTTTGATTTTTGGGTTTTTTGSGSTTTTAGATTTTVAGGSTTTVAGDGTGTTSTTRGAGVLSAASSQNGSSGALAATGQGLTLAGLGLLLIYVGRVVYLVARPRRAANGR